MSSEKDDQRKKTSSDSSEDSFNLKLGDPYKSLEESIVGTIFVNRENRIKSIITSVSELINLSSFDKDLEINDFARQLKYEGVANDIKQVFKDRNIIKKEVEGKNGRWYLLELRPHKTEDREGGVVITFVDITGLKETEHELAQKVEKIKELQQQIIKNDVSERWKLGQFLHDDLAQTLIGAEILLHQVKDKLANGENNIEEDIDQLVDILSEKRAHVRNLSHELVPADIGELGITNAFDNFARQLERIHDIHCEMEYDNTMDNLTNVEIATHLYRITEEAIRNAVAHGNAENVKVTVKSENDYLHLTIEDDGTGFSDSVKENGGMGLNIMRHRVELTGGTFKIFGSTGLGSTGATISCKIPIEQ